MRNKILACSISALVFGVCGELTASAETLLLRDPALSSDHIAFVYAGDIWISNRDGSAPRRLTSQASDEGGPVFSPDGQTIAFTAQYQGNTDVYSISIAGGQPSRHTWHPGDDTVIDWSRDGKAIAFTSRRETLSGRSAQLYHIGLEGGLPVRQMQARIFRGTYNASGRKLASIPFGPAYNALYGGSSGWKGYRGGSTPSIEIIDGGISAQIPGERVNDLEPMWIGEQVYFLSDRDNKLFNIHKYDPDGTVTKVTSEDVWDIRAADAHGSTIVYETGGRLKLLDTTNGAVTPLIITLSPDLPQLQPQWKSVAGQITSADISRSAKRVAITARGEVFSVPVKDGSIRNISDSPGVREYSALWSPDGLSLAYIVEDDRKQTLRIEDQSGLKPARAIDLGADFYTLLDWGGEGQNIIFQDNHLKLHALDIESGRQTMVAEDDRREWGFGGMETDTSPDGQWLAYVKEESNFNRNLYMYNFADRQSYKVTDGLADVGSPVFSKDGKLLFFSASTNSGPQQVGLDMTTQEQPYRSGIYVAVLEADGKSPLAPMSGDEEAETSDDADDENIEATILVAIDGIENRLVALPVAEAAYSDLSTAEDGNLYFIKSVQPGVSNLPPGESPQVDAELLRFNIEDREIETLMADITALAISDDGSNLIVAKSDQSLHVGEIGDSLEVTPLDLSGLRLHISPQEEWAQIFDDVWRMEAAYFYDPAMHGLDWQAVYDQYKPLLAHVGRREDLNALLSEMIAEMQVGHNRVSGGDTLQSAPANVGLLGADFALENGRHKITRIYTGESWNPFLEAPLAHPGMNISAGDYILAVNGRELTETDNIFALLEGTVDALTVLRVSSRSNGQDARDVVVEPVNTERGLRLWAWVEGNRKAVGAATNGRVGYVYLPNTAGAGFTFFNRMFFAQTDKDGMIIDERSNGGGQAANYITDVLNRTYLSGWKDRDGMIFNTPGGGMFGPKLMLIDQDAGSGGDFLPYSFRKMNIGTLVGKRTWGGLIGISANPGLVDGGFLTVPYFRFFDTDGAWSVENEGVAPDIDIALDPIATNAGRDTQLEAAIEEVLRQISTTPSPVPTIAPPYPTRVGD